MKSNMELMYIAEIIIWAGALCLLISRDSPGAAGAIFLARMIVLFFQIRRIIKERA